MTAPAGRELAAEHGPIRVMIVEDSPSVRCWLESLINEDPRLRVASVVSSGEEALSAIDRVRPDVISLDIHLPGMSGICATREIMSHRPTPIVICSAGVSSADCSMSMRAIQAGALSVVQKPPGPSCAEFACVTTELCTQLARMSSVGLVRRRFHARRSGVRASPPPPIGVSRHTAPPSALGVVSSTGGPRALATMLSTLPREFPIPILLVQHITPSFHDGLVSWLDGLAEVSVVSASEGDHPLAGHVHVAAPGSHMLLERGRICLRQDTGQYIYIPAGDLLLRSLADDLGSAAAGVVLTGMGDDGARGLLDIRRAGGLTIAEDESTAVVFGMPRVAASIGAAELVLPCDAIAPELCRMIGLAGAAA